MTDFEQYRLQPRHDALAYALMLRKLFPKGKIWGYLLPSEDNIIYDSNLAFPEWDDDNASANIVNDTNTTTGGEGTFLGKLMMVIGGELARVESRAYNLINERVPALSVELIEEYREQFVDVKSEEALITSDNDVALLAHAKTFDVTQAFSETNAESLAATLGFTVNVVQGSTVGNPAICGDAVCGNQVCGSRGIYSTILVEVLVGAANYELLQSIFEDYKPAHCVLVWDDQR